VPRTRVFRSSRSLKLDYTMETVTLSRNVCPARYGEPVNKMFRNFFFSWNSISSTEKKVSENYIRWMSISRGTNVRYLSAWDVDILLQHTPYKIIAKWPSVTLFIAFFGFSYQIWRSTAWSMFGSMGVIRHPEYIGKAFGTYFIDNKHHTSDLNSNNIDKSAFSRIRPNAAEHLPGGCPDIPRIFICID